jgi:hypothetical protein
MAEQGTGWNGQLENVSGEAAALDRANSSLVIARMMKYCEDEAHALNLPFVAYCLSLAMGALAEHVDDLGGGWSATPRSTRRVD